jgi:hypothetical protein
MYLFSIPRTKPNGMDDVNVNEYSDGVPIKLYKKFFKDKVYFYKTKEWCVSYKVGEITLAYGGGYRVQCMILNLKYNLDNKVSSSKMNLLCSYFRNGIKGDLGLFSMNDLDVVILNRYTFEIVEKKNPHTLMSGYEFYKESVGEYSIFSPKDGKDDSIMSYMTLLRTNRFR